MLFVGDVIAEKHDVPRGSIMIDVACVFVLQIVIESFPVSSSGHLFLLKNLLGITINSFLFETLEHLAHGPMIVILGLILIALIII